jgi:hypothetical protein
MSTGNSVRITFFIFVYFFVSTILRNLLRFDCLSCGLGTYFHHLQREVTCKFYFILSFTVNYDSLYRLWYDCSDMLHTRLHYFLRGMVSCLGNNGCPKSKLICYGFPLDCSFQFIYVFLLLEYHIPILRVCCRLVPT